MLKSETLPKAWPDAPPVYDICKSYLENAEKGPFFSGKIPERTFPSLTQWSKFLGFDVASKLGVPAGPLLNSNWVAFAASMGFDIVTYKTIRSQQHPAHPVPNMIYVETKDFLSPHEEGGILHQAKNPPREMDKLAATNSFGIPSREPSYLMKDIAKAKSALRKGQVLIVSIVGTPRPDEDFVEDFAKTASLALEGGAEIIEADFSCPNVISCEGSIHTNPDSVYQISKRLRQTIGNVPLVIKVGVFTEKDRLRQVMNAAARAGVQAICGINTVSMQVIKEDGSPALGANRIRSGVCGGPIRQAALDFIHHAVTINREEKLDLTVMGTGGITAPEHFDLFFEMGADVAMSAVGMMWDPYLAMRYHQKRGFHA